MKILEIKVEKEETFDICLVHLLMEHKVVYCTHSDFYKVTMIFDNGKVAEEIWVRCLDNEHKDFPADKLYGRDFKDTEEFEDYYDGLFIYFESDKNTSNT